MLYAGPSETSWNNRFSVICSDKQANKSLILGLGFRSGHFNEQDSSASPSKSTWNPITFFTIFVAI